MRGLMKVIYFFSLMVVLTLLSVSQGQAEERPSDMPYLDQNFSCIAQNEAQKFTADFNIDVKSFGGLELCRNEVDTKKLFNDLNLIKNGQFTSTGKNNLIRNFVDSARYYDWMKSQTRGVERGNDVPYATAYNSGGYFTMQDGWSKLSTLGRVGTVIHEARHTGGYRHIPCNQGPYQGASIAGCDRDYNYGGSHAIEMEYYAHVSVQGTNFHPVYKKMARLMAIARSNIFFNTPILKTRSAVLTLSADHQASYLYDQGEWVKRELPLSSGGQLKRTSFGAVLFDGAKALSLEMYQNSGFVDAVEDVYSYFKLLAETTVPVKDLEEFDSGVKRYVVQVTQDDRLSAFDFPNGQWGTAQKIPFRVVQTSTAIPSLNKSGYFLISENGQIFSYQPETQRLVSQAGQWDASNIKVVNFENQNLILRQDGKIYVQNNTSLQPWAAAQGVYSDLVTVPLYDAFEVIKE